MAQSLHSSFEDELTVHPWDKLVSHLIDSIDGEAYDTLKQQSRSKIDIATVKNPYDYFRKLKKKMGQKKAVHFLRNVMRNMNFHGDQGI